MESRQSRPVPAILSYGFRPFFLSGAVYGALMVGLWVPWFYGLFTVPTALDPISWHVHELLFGFTPAIIAGFLLTAIPNWTGRTPVAGIPLANLFLLWLIGRLAIAVSTLLNPVVTALVTLAFPVCLTIVAAREIIAGRNWRNVKVLFCIGTLAAAQALFHIELAQSGTSVIGANLAVAAAIILTMIIGGRIVPNFTSNWIRRANPGREPAPFDEFDRWTMIVSGIALTAWTLWPLADGLRPVAGGLFVVAWLMNGWRQIRWAPDRTLNEPLVSILHIAYAFLPLGFLLNAVALLADDHALASAALHAWVIGAIGLMMLAVMTRASLGHTGRVLSASKATVGIFALMIIAAAARIVGALVPDLAFVFMAMAGIAWVSAFLGYAVHYGPMLVSKRVDA